MTRGPQPLAVVLSDEDRVVLERWSRRPKGPHSIAQRARIVLLAADGLTTYDNDDAQPKPTRNKKRRGSALTKITAMTV